MTQRTSPPSPPSPPYPPTRWPVALLLAAAVALLPLACGPAEGSDHGTEAPLGPSSGPSPEPSDDPGGGSSRPTGGPSDLDLPTPYLRLIRAEMLEIEGAMQEELGHLARGEPHRGAEVARQIHQSFVLKQRLSEEERKELASLLPERFLTLDREFHGRAERLAQAFEQRDFTAAAELYSEMTRACVRCHGRFATDRFPALAGEDDGAPQPAPER